MTVDFSGLAEIPAIVDKIIVSGVDRTDAGLLKKQFKNLIKSSNINELLRNVREAKDRLEKLGIFRSVIPFVDVSDQMRPQSYKVIFNVQEKRPVTARIGGTHSTDGATRLCSNVRLNNIFGRAESADMDLEFGPDKFASKCAAVMKPLEGNPDIRLSVGGVEGNWDHSWAKFARHERSVFAELQADTWAGIHKLQWDGMWRELRATDPKAPWFVRKQNGSSQKCSLRHIFQSDTRSDLVFPDAGHLFKITNEMATICPGSPTGELPQAGDAGAPRADPAIDDRGLQLRLDAAVQKPFRLTDWLVAELSLSTGLVHSLTGHPVSIADRFFLGGPLELRGFQWHSVGPVQPLLGPAVDVPTAGDGPTVPATTAPTTGPAEVSPIGAESFWLAGTHLYTPLPYWGAAEDSLASHFRLHGFCIAGSTLDRPIQQLKSSWSQNSTSTGLSRLFQASKRVTRKLAGEPRVVIGAGLVARFAGMLRLELNYSVPVKVQPGDAWKSGFTFGFGIYYV